jgi:hypothetical protein
VEEEIRKVDDELGGEGTVERLFLVGEAGHRSVSVSKIIDMGKSSIEAGELSNIFDTACLTNRSEQATSGDSALI